MPPIPIPILNIYLIHRLWDEESGAQEETRDVTPMYIYKPCFSSSLRSQVVQNFTQLVKEEGQRASAQEASWPETKWPDGQKVKCPRAREA